MKLFSVFEPKHAQKTSLHERGLDMVFVPHGFSVWAFLFPFLWLLINRLWIGLVIYILFMIGFGVLMAGFSVSGLSLFVIDFGVRLIFGFYAQSFRRWLYRQKGWKEWGVTAARDRLDAELRFFDNFLLRENVAQPPQHKNLAGHMPFQTANTVAYPSNIGGKPAT